VGEANEAGKFPKRVITYGPPQNPLGERKSKESKQKNPNRRHPKKNINVSKKMIGG
jgi:hypothetical protein